MKKKDFWKKLLVFSLVLVFSISMSACGPKSDDAVAEEEYIDLYEDEEPQIGVEDESGWTRIDPKGDDYTVIFDSEKENIAAIVEGTILGKYYKDDCEFIISKPEIPENLMYTLEQYKYNYVMVTQSGGELSEVELNNGGCTLLICFPDKLEIRAYDHRLENGAGSGGSPANFEYVPNRNEGEEWDRIVSLNGYANTSDPIDLTDHESDCDNIIYLIENIVDYYQ